MVHSMILRLGRPFFQIMGSLEPPGYTVQTGSSKCTHSETECPIHSTSHVPPPNEGILETSMSDTPATVRRDARVDPNLYSTVGERIGSG